MKQRVVAISTARRRAKSKAVAASQAALEALPLNSGTWAVRGISGLYVRCRARAKSFYIQRRIRGALVKKTLGEMTLKAARTAAMREWARMKPRPAGGRVTFAEAFTEFLAQKELSPRTREIYRYNCARYLDDWKGRALEDIGKDRAGVRALYHRLRQKHGKATASQTIRMFAAVYRYARRADGDLPESPTCAVDLPTTKARDWALSPEKLKVWWQSTEVDDEGNEIARGVKALGPIKRAWWMTCLFTGARRGSIEAMKWADIDFDRKVIRFEVAKGGRTYSVPAADRLIALLTTYRDGGEVPPSDWVFPSPIGEGHLVNVRDDKRGVTSAHHLRHTYRTVLAELGAGTDQARMLMGHSMGGDVSRGYITSALVLESLRPLANAAAEALWGMLGAEPQATEGRADAIASPKG